MNAYLPLNGIELWHIAGWTMVHFLWLGALVAAAAAVCRFFLRRTSPGVRYACMLAWLIALATLPIGTAAWLYKHTPPSRESTTTAIAHNTPFQIIELHQPTLASPATANLPPQTAATHRAQSAIHNPQSEIESTPAITPSPLLTTLESCIPYLPWLWLIGTPITLALLLTGVVGTRRLGRASRTITEGPIAELLSQLTASLRIGKRVTVAVCDRIAAPVLIGIIRPIILLPPAALTGWSPAEIEMVLLHELAHVRRWDNLINLLQRLVESLLFFHPAVWLISTWVRREREACCDAVVVTRTNRPHAYAEMLIALAAQLSEPSEPGRPRPRFLRLTPSLHSAMAAGPLRSRIRRILQLEDDPMLVSGKSFVLMLAALVAAATLAVLYVPTIGQAEQPATKATENAEDAKKTNAESEARLKKTQDNLKSIAIAMQIYHDTHGSLPPHAQYGADKKPLLSWRVLILPHIGEDKLYKEFHLDEPWDSDHNRKLIARMPDLFKNPKLDKPGMTNYLAVVGKECAFNGSPKGLGIQSISDGTSNTIAIVEANADQAVEWTKPQDWNFVRRQPTKGLGQLWPGGWYAAWVDGSIRRVDNGEPADKVGIYFTRAGREQASLKESANRPSTASEGPAAADPAAAGEGGPSAEFGPSSKFPSLEDQKLADLVFKQLNLELEPLDEADLQRAKALGYDGGVTVASTTNVDRQNILANDLLVGLHVWPTTNLKDVVEILRREDIHDLRPLKFYVIRKGTYGDPANPTVRDEVRTGRVNFAPGGFTSPSAARTEATRAKTDPSGTITYIPPTPANAEELEVLRERVKIIEEQYKTFNALYENGQKGGSLERVKSAAYELALAKGELALAEGHPDEAIHDFKEARKNAEEALKAIQASYHANKITYDVLLQAIRNVSDIKLKLIRLQAKPTGSTSATEPLTPNAQPTAMRAVNAPSDRYQAPSPPPTAALNRYAPTPANIPQSSATKPPLGRELGAGRQPVVAETAPPAGAIPAANVAPPNVDPLSGVPTNSVTTTAADQPSKSNLRYDGKTFDEWREAWKTELSTEKRTEAIKALAAFGANGYGKEAAQAILEVAGQYDWKSIGANKAVEPLQNACVEALDGTWDATNRAVAPSISATDSLPALSAAANSGNRKQKLFLTYVLPRIPGPESVGLRLILSNDKDATVRQYALRTLPNLASNDYDEKVSARIHEALNSSDPGDVAAAIFVISPSRDKSAARAPYPYLPELDKWIFSPEEAVRRQVRNLITSLQGDDAAHVAEATLAVLKDDSKKKQHIEAIRALAALGPNAKSAVDTLRPLVKSDDQSLVIAAAAALRRILKQPEYSKLLVEELGDRFNLQMNGAFLQLPGGEKQEEFHAFERAVQAEEKQLFP